MASGFCRAPPRGRSRHSPQPSPGAGDDGRADRQGALLLFVPYCTDLRSGHLRVLRSCAARAVENQVYVVAAGNVGHCPGVTNFDIQYAQSAVLTPCDTMFPPEGVAAEASAQVEQVVFADLDLALLQDARRNGTVKNLIDRRPELYARWRGH